MLNSVFILAYVGPETILPLTSALAAIAGVAMIFWRFILTSVIKLYRLVTGAKPPEEMEDVQGEEPTSST